MHIIKVNTAECRIGSILARDIADKKGIILAAQGVAVNAFIRNKLVEMGIKTIWVYSSHNQKYKHGGEKRIHKLRENHKETVLSVKSVLNDLAAGKHVERDKIDGIAGRIFNHINDVDCVLGHLKNLKAFDDYTYYHSTNVAFYAMLIGKWMRMPKECILDLIVSGLLHDIGKLGIPTEVLNKQGRLTTEEFETVKKHSKIGYEMLRDGNNLPASVKEAVLLHHERMDGSGYPIQAAGDSICDYAKVIAVADVYDAMTSDRIYKKRATPFSAFHMFLTEGTSLFEPSVAKTFVFNIAPHMIGTKVMLNTGEIGEVVYVPPHEVARPVVSVDSFYVDLSKERKLQIESLL